MRDPDVESADRRKEARAASEKARQLLDERRQAQKALKVVSARSRCSRVAEGKEWYRDSREDSLGHSRVGSSKSCLDRALRVNAYAHSAVPDTCCTCYLQWRSQLHWEAWPPRPGFGGLNSSLNQ